jgi:hypothetical protein
MTYAGNKSQSEAVHYKDARFTHSKIVNGRVVNYYDCWTHDDKVPDTFSDRLQKSKTSSLDSLFRGMEDSFGETLDLDDDDD